MNCHKFGLSERKYMCARSEVQVTDILKYRPIAALLFGLVQKGCILTNPHGIISHTT